MDDGAMVIAEQLSSAAEQFARTHGVLSREVMCWMVYLWRAIALNGMNMSHVFVLRTRCADTLELAWLLLSVRVWAAAIECATFIRPDRHPALCASVYSGRPTLMPGWAKRGMPIPFIFDLMYMTGVYSCDSLDAIVSANFVYHMCLCALNQETDAENAFINADPFFASLLNITDTPSMWDFARSEYVLLVNNPLLKLPSGIMMRHETSQILFNNLMAVFRRMQTVREVQLSFYRVYNGLTTSTVPIELQWDRFFVQ